MGRTVPQRNPKYGPVSHSSAYNTSNKIFQNLFLSKLVIKYRCLNVIKYEHYLIQIYNKHYTGQLLEIRQRRSVELT